MLPSNHPLRRALADEPHARPATPVVAPAVVSCLALHGADADELFLRLSEIARLHAEEPPKREAAHGILELGVGRLKWERHGEFASLVVVRNLPGLSLATLDDFPTAFSIISERWLASLPGKVIAAADVLLVPDAPPGSGVARANNWFVTHTTAASVVQGDAARILTAFVLREDGRTRWTVLDASLGPAQSAHLVQSIVEIELYRMMALLAFPMARQTFPILQRIEERLAAVMSDMSRVRTTAAPTEVEAEERRQLDELTRLAAEVEGLIAGSEFRFSSARAYWEIVEARVTELRERRIGDMRTLGGFLARRMAPAMKTVDATARRQESLSNRIERGTALLRTRVDVAREEQNLALLADIDRRGKLQLRLQETVEGLSIAAIT